MESSAPPEPSTSRTRNPYKTLQKCGRLRKPPYRTYRTLSITSSLQEPSTLPATLQPILLFGEREAFQKPLKVWRAVFLSFGLDALRDLYSHVITVALARLCLPSCISKQQSMKFRNQWEKPEKPQSGLLTIFFNLVSKAFDLLQFHHEIWRERYSM